MTEVAEMRYKADITAGALKLPESRLVADLLLRKVDAEGWKDAIVTKNVLQARSPATATRLTKLIRGRLESMGPDLWKLVRDGKGSFNTSPTLIWKLGLMCPALGLYFGAAPARIFVGVESLPPGVDPIWHVNAADLPPRRFVSAVE